MRVFTIIGGVNGAGKSSLSGVLSAESSELTSRKKEYES
jgi:predicted ABC-type ATPase